MDILRRVLKQTGWQLVGKAATSISTLAVLGLVSRNYGESGVGVFTLALTYLSFFYLATDLGLNGYVLHRFQETTDVEWRKLLGFRLVWVVFLIPLAFIASLFLPVESPVFSPSILLGSGALIGSALFVTSNALFQNLLRYDLSIAASSLGAFITLIAVFLVVFLRMDVPFLMVAHASGWITCGVLSVTLARKICKRISPIFDLKYAREILLSAWPVSVTLLINTIYFRADTFIVSAFWPLSDVGNYNVAYQLFQTVLVFPAFVMNSYYPVMLKLMRADKIKFLKQTGMVAGLMFVAGAVCSIFVYPLSPFLVALLTGGGFKGSEESLRILSLGFPAYFASSVLMWVYMSMRRFKMILVVYLVGFAVNLILNFSFIPEYSYKAASYITGISEYLILVLQLIILYGVSFSRFPLRFRL